MYEKWTKYYVHLSYSTYEKINFVHRNINLYKNLNGLPVSNRGQSINDRVTTAMSDQHREELSVGILVKILYTF